MSRFLFYSEIATIWEDFNDWSVPLPSGKRAWRTSHKRAKLVWDNYGIEGYPFTHNETMMAEMHRLFPKDEGCRIYMPLGQFHDFAHLDHEGIYNSFVASMSKKKRDRDGRMISMADALWPHVEDVWSRCFPDWVATKKDFLEGLSILFYGSAFGIWMEALTFQILEERVEKKYGGKYVVEMAPSSMERLDVDAVIKRSTGETAVKISIKCKKALSDKTVQYYRTVKKKDAPDIYFGILDEEDAEERVLSKIKIDDMSLNDLLKADYKKWKQGE